VVKITNSVMGKISYKYQMRIQTFREIGFGYRTVVSCYKFSGKGLKDELGKSNLLIIFH